MSGAATVTLSWDDVETAAHVGLRRALTAMKNHTNNKYGATRGVGRIELDIYGAIAEFAVAQHFNLHWHSCVGVVGKVDVGRCIEVKSARRDDDCLLLHLEYKDQLPFVLGIIERLPVVSLRGWLFAYEGKQTKYLRDPNGRGSAYFVPQEELHSMDALKAHLRSVLPRYENGAA